MSVTLKITQDTHSIIRILYNRLSQGFPQVFTACRDRQAFKANTYTSIRFDKKNRYIFFKEKKYDQVQSM